MNAGGPCKKSEESESLISELFNMLPGSYDLTFLTQKDWQFLRV